MQILHRNNHPSLDPSEILRWRRGLPLRRSWIAQPYSEEVITQPEEEVLPAIQQCLAVTASGGIAIDTRYAERFSD
jgi:hypothetical protein